MSARIAVVEPWPNFDAQYEALVLWEYSVPEDWLLDAHNSIQHRLAARGPDV